MRLSENAHLPFDKTVIPGEHTSLPRTRYGVERDPESRKLSRNHVILDLPPSSAGDGEMGNRLSRQKFLT